MTSQENYIQINSK